MPVIRHERIFGRPNTPKQPSTPFRLGIATLVLVALGAAACSSSPPSASTKPISANKLVEQGLNAESLGQIDQAIADFKQAIATSPKNVYAYYDLGVIYQQQVNDPSLAATWYRRALNANPSYTPAIFNLAILETPSDPQSAVALYQRILAIKPNDADTNFNLGLLLISQNQVTQGKADLSKAISLDPSLASRVPKGITP